MKIFCKNCSHILTLDAGDTSPVTCPECSAEVVRPESEFASGVVIGDFRIDGLLGVGGMGTVYLATQISLDRPVALKVLQKEFVHDREYVAGLFREARAAAKISHPNVVQAFAVGRDGDYVFFAMELVRGDTLKNILRNDGALPPVKAAKIVLDIARALDVAWREQKLVHQDIKPDNIMLDVNGFTKLADLGLAKSAGMKEESDDSDEVLGTPQYISPEQLTGVPTDARSDIYSLGATFYHIVTGKLPYRASDLEELAKLHEAGNLVPPKNIKGDLPDKLNDIIVKMMARSIDQRYQTPQELIADLENFLSSKPAQFAESADVQDGNQGKKIKITVAPKIVPKINIPSAPVNPAASVSEEPVQGTPKVVPIAPKPVVVPSVPKPVVPSVPKPVVPSVPKPVVPSVPKPVVPSVPKPVVPSVPKPVVPPAAPVAPPVVSAAANSAPSAQEEDIPKAILRTVAPSPEAPFAPVEQPAAGDKAPKSAGSKKIKKILAIVAISIFGMILLAAVAGGVLYFLESSGKMSPVISPYISKVFPKAKASASKKSAAVEKEESASTESVEENSQEMVTSASTLEEFEITGRREYMEAVSELFAWRGENQDANEELLKKIDELWPVLGYPVTPMEEKELIKIKMMFSSADEYIRCNVEREKLRKKHLADFAAAEAYFAEQKKAEAEAAEKKLLEQKEAERLAAESAKIHKENQEREKARLAEIVAGCKKQLNDCVVAMMNSLISENDEAFNEAIAAANIFVSYTATFNNNEKNALAQLRNNLNALKAEKKKLAGIFAKFRKIRREDNIRIDLKNGTSLLCEIKSGKLICYVDALMRESEQDYAKAADLTRMTLFMGLSHYMRMNESQVEFYSDLFHRKRPADNKVPNGFWKRVWPLIKNSL